MKNIKTYEDFCNEEINWRKGIAGVALGASLISSCGRFDHDGYAKHDGEEITINMQDGTKQIGLVVGDDENNIIIDKGGDLGEVSVPKHLVSKIEYKSDLYKEEKSKYVGSVLKFDAGSKKSDSTDIVFSGSLYSGNDLLANIDVFNVINNTVPGDLSGQKPISISNREFKCIDVRLNDLNEISLVFEDGSDKFMLPLVVKFGQPIFKNLK